MVISPVRHKEPITMGLSNWLYLETDTEGLIALTRVVGFLRPILGIYHKTQHIFMATLFVILLLVSIVVLVIGLIKPATINLASRKKVGIIYGSAIVILFFLVGATSDNNKTKNETGSTTATNTVFETQTPVATTPVKTTEQTPVQKSSVVQETPAPKPVATPVTAKSYQQIFSFSGSGAKKSEPFIITGDRFKIKYNCTGEFCQAFLYSTADNSIKSLIMNEANATTDETIIYGSGEYYIDANTMGNYTMTVEDYK